MAAASEDNGRCHTVAEDIAGCSSSVAPETPPPAVGASPENASNSDSWRVGIDDLPDEILIKIFFHMSFRELIDIIQKVSRRWRRLSQDLELWADKRYHIGNWTCYGSDTTMGVVTDQEAIQTFHDAPNLRKVCLHRSASSRVFRALYSTCHRLTELRLHYTQKLSYSVLKNLVEKCPKINTLWVSHELLKSKKYSEIVSQLQHLRVLNMDVHYTQKALVLQPLGDGCPELAEVDFGFSSIDLDDLRYFLHAKRNTLKSIRIKWGMVGERCVLPLLTVCASSLECLRLHDFELARDEASEAFTAVGGLKNLQELKMPILKRIPHGAAAMAFKAGGLPKLRRLDLQGGLGLEDDAVIAIIHGCPALQDLNVRYAVRVSDAAFSQIYRLEHLEKLDVSGCNGLGGALIPCLAGLPRLHTLLLEEMELPKLQPGLSSIHELSSLRCLSFSHSNATGVPFDKFPGKLVSLRELRINRCRGDPTDADGLTKLMPGLEIFGSFEPEEQGFAIEFEESDSELEEAQNGQNAGPGNNDEGWGDSSESDETVGDTTCSSEYECDYD